MEFFIIVHLHLKAAFHFYLPPSLTSMDKHRNIRGTMKKRAEVLQSYKLTPPSVQNPTENLASEVGHDQGYLLSKNGSINHTLKLAPS